VHPPPQGVGGERLWIVTDIATAYSEGIDNEDYEEEERERKRDVYQALYDYVHKKGPWTDELASIWKDYV
jgi:hypothetical protein